MSTELLNRRRVARAILAYAQATLSEDEFSYIEKTWPYDAAAIKSAVGGVTGQDVVLSRGESADYFREIVNLSVLGPMLPFMLRTDFRAPFNSAAQLRANFVAEGRPIPVSRSSLVDSSLEARKIASLSVHTYESLRQRRSDEQFARAHETEIRHALETAFIDPENIGLDGAPVSVTAAAEQVSATSDPAASIKLLCRDFKNLDSTFLICGPETALQLSLATVGGVNVFPDVGVRGGQLGGIPVLVSGSVPYDSDGAPIILLDASRVAVALGDVTVSRSNDAMVAMQNSFDSDGGGELYVSMFQTHAVALKTVQMAAWQLADAEGCRILIGANW